MMSAPRAPRSLIVLVAAIVLAGVPVAAVGGFGLLLYPPYACVGALLAIRRPRNPIGWLLIGLSWALRIVEALAARLRGEVDLDRVGGKVQSVVGQTLAPSSVGVWFRPSKPASER